MKLPTLPNLDGLIGLSRREGVDIRPTLLRVLTDLYVQKSAHTREEESRYTELALWLLAGVDVSTRVTVANKLAIYASAPRPVVRRLARDLFEVAEPVLLHSPGLTGDDLARIAAELGPRHAASVATRQQREVARPPAGASSDSQKVERPAVGHRFLAASAAERRVLLDEIEHSSSVPAVEPVPLPSRDIIGRLESAALAQRADDFARELEFCLHIPRETAHAIVDDAHGEPVVVVAKALRIGSDTLLRILLFLNPTIGQSVERVFALVQLYDELTTAAALRLVASWCSPPASERQQARYQPVHYDDERSGQRRASREHPRGTSDQARPGRTTTPADAPARRGQGTT